MAVAPHALRVAQANVPDGDAKRESSPDELLLTAILERSAADVGWLAWGDGKDAVVVPGVARSFLNPSTIAEFPDPPREPLVPGARHSVLRDQPDPCPRQGGRGDRPGQLPRRRPRRL